MANVSGDNRGIIPPTTPTTNGAQTPPTTPELPNPNPIVATTSDVAATALINSQPSPTTENPASLAGRATPQVNEGAIGKLFRWLFSSVKPEERRDADAIEKLIKDTNGALSKFDNEVRELARFERREISRPNELSPETYSRQFGQMRLHLAEARQHLANLEGLRSRAGALAEAHRTFNDLPGNIQKLKDKVDFLSAQEELFTEMHALENAMANYSLNKSWDNFIAIRDRRAALVEKLKTPEFREVFTHSPFLKSNAKAQALFQKENWSDIDVYQFIKISFPVLKNQAERLEKSTIEMTNERVKNLETQANRLKLSITQYKDLSKRIANSEWWIQQIENNTLIGRIYKFFHRNSLTNLQKDVQQLQEWQRETSDKLRQGQEFNKPELAWLTNVSLIKPNKRDKLSRHIDVVYNASIEAQTKQSLSDQMAQVIKDLDFYRTALSNPKYAKFDDLKNAIATGLRGLAQNAEGRQMGVEELEKHLNRLYPHLQERIALIFILIRDTDLHAELNAALLGQAMPATPTAVSTPTPTPIPTPVPTPAETVIENVPDAPPMDNPEAPPMDVPDAPPMDVPDAPIDAPVNTGPTATPPPKKPPTPAKKPPTQIAGNMAEQIRSAAEARKAKAQAGAATNAPPQTQRPLAEDNSLMGAMKKEFAKRAAVNPTTDEVPNPDTKDEDWD